MAPKKVTIDDGEAVYRSEAPLRQKKFPARKTARRSLPAASKPKLEKQSTLTQRWSFDGPYSDPVNLADDIEDTDEDENDDCKIPEPKRKRRRMAPPSTRTTGVGKSQNTMTQMGYVTSFSSHVQNEESDEELHRATVTEEEDAQDMAREVTLFEARETGEEEDVVPESQDANMTAVNACVDSSPMVRVGQRPSPEIPLSNEPVAKATSSNAQPSTPRKVFPSTIPSSNTPMSALVFATQSQQPQRSPSKSPLSERSTNVPDSSRRAPLSPVQETPAKQQHSFSPWSIRKTPLFKVPARKTPAVYQSSTLQSDDQPVQDTQAFTSATSMRPPRRLVRIPSTIQDSQFGTSAQEITYSLDGHDDQGHNDLTQGEYQATLPYDFTQYDTVASALERDAARCDQTQRLQLHRRTGQPDVVLDTQIPSGGNTLVAKADWIDPEPVGFASVHADRNPQGFDGHGLSLGSVSVKSESLPATPEHPERSHHRPRFHNVDVVDLTADSFDALVPTISGSPTPRNGSQAPLNIIRDITSSPPLVRREFQEKNMAGVEYLPLNDVASTARPGLALHVPPSQVSTVGDPTQPWRSQARRTHRTQRTQVKQEPEEPPFSTPQASRHDEVDLDGGDAYARDEDENIDIDEPVLTDDQLNRSNIEHIDLSDQVDPADDSDYIDIDDDMDLAELPPSSPFPIPPGHTREEYTNISDEDMSSSLPAPMTSPPSDHSHFDLPHIRPHIKDHVPLPRKPISPFATFQADDESTPRNNMARLSCPPWEVPGLKARIQQPISSDKARGKRPVLAIPDSDESEDDGDLLNDDELEADLPVQEQVVQGKGEPQSHREQGVHAREEGGDERRKGVDEEEEYSWHFRPAREILPDTQYSLAIPPVPFSSSPLGP